jgi:hypothetical protein
VVVVSSGDASGTTSGTTGSTTTTAAVVVERLAYDPWGKRRSTSGQPDPKDLLVGSATERGYTQHEHLDELALMLSAPIEY